MGCELGEAERRRFKEEEEEEGAGDGLEAQLPKLKRTAWEQSWVFPFEGKRLMELCHWHCLLPWLLLLLFLVSREGRMSSSSCSELSVGFTASSWEIGGGAILSMLTDLTGISSET